MTGNSFMNEGNRPFYFHFKVEQKRIDDAIHDLQRIVRQASTEGEISERLTRLRDMMAQHFEEEEGGCLDEIVTQHPYLSGETRQMEQEHRLLLEEFDALIEDATQDASSTKWKARFNEFEQSLMEHERQERALVRRGLQLSEEDA